MQRHPDSSIIDALGSTTFVASIFEVQPQAVSQWRRDGIPRARRQTLRLMRPDLFVDRDTAAEPIDTEGAPAIPAEAARDAA